MSSGLLDVPKDEFWFMWGPELSICQISVISFLKRAKQNTGTNSNSSKILSSRKNIDFGYTFEILATDS